MAITPKIALNAQTNCGYITVEDITSNWTLVSGSTPPDTREEFGLLLLWTKDAWTTPYADTTNPGDNSTAAEWDIIATGNGTYEVTVYYIATYLDGKAYVVNDLVFYDGSWYHCIQNGTAKTPDTETAYWRVFSFATADIVSNKALLDAKVGNPTNYSFSVTGNEVLDCIDDYSVVKTDCHEYTLYCDLYTNVSDGVGGILPIYIYITDVVGTMISCTEYVGTVEEFDISNTVDGVYIVYIGNFDFENVAWEDYSTFVINDYCDIFTCFESLVLSVMCREFDPCCETCDAEVLKNMEIRRLELNKMVALVGMMMAKIHVEATRYLGIWEVDEDRMDYVMEVSDIIEKLKVISGRCGDCNGTMEDTTSQCDEC